MRRRVRPIPLIPFGWHGGPQGWLLHEGTALEQQAATPSARYASCNKKLQRAIADFISAADDATAVKDTSMQQPSYAATVKAVKKKLPWWLARPREAQDMALAHDAKRIVWQPCLSQNGLAFLQRSLVSLSMPWLVDQRSVHCAGVKIQREASHF